MDGESSDEFVVKVGVHQGSGPEKWASSNVFAVVMIEITRDVKEGDVKEILYADDLSFMADSVWSFKSAELFPFNKCQLNSCSHTSWSLYSVKIQLVWRLS